MMADVLRILDHTKLVDAYSQLAYTKADLLRANHGHPEWDVARKTDRSSIPLLGAIPK